MPTDDRIARTVARVVDEFSFTYDLMGRCGLFKEDIQLLINELTDALTGSQSNPPLDDHRPVALGSLNEGSIFTFVDEGKELVYRIDTKVGERITCHLVENETVANAYEQVLRGAPGGGSINE
jgi:hypothetical protein